MAKLKQEQWIVRSTINGGDAEYSIHPSKRNAVDCTKKYLSEKVKPDGMMNIDWAEHLSESMMDEQIEKWFKDGCGQPFYVGCYSFEIIAALSDGEGTACAA